MGRWLHHLACSGWRSYNCGVVVWSLVLDCELRIVLLKTAPAALRRLLFEIVGVLAMVLLCFYVSLSCVTV